MCIKCPFCEVTTDDLETAEAADWVPGYWSDGNEWLNTPVCPTCSALRLQVDEHGELELKPQ